MANNPTRRFVLTGAAGAAAFAALAPAAQALSTDQARSLIDRLVAEINRVINSGRSERQMLGDFERIFATYADVATIARSTLGPDARSASAAQMRAYTDAFTGYMARKYGKRFREFIGGQVVVETARPVKSFYEVKTIAILRGTSPFNVTFLVSDRSGRDLFFDMLIEGISLLKSERAEIGAMLDARRGDLDAFIADLRQAG